MERVWTDQFWAAETKLPHASRVTEEMVPAVMHFHEGLSLIRNVRVKTYAWWHWGLGGGSWGLAGQPGSPNQSSKETISKHKAEGIREEY